VFDLYTQVICHKGYFYHYTAVEQERFRLLADKRIIEVTDFGAGSRALGKTNSRSISDIAKHSLKPAKYGQLLYRLVNFFQPETIVELGTSLGVTTSYLAAPVKNAQVITFEGCPNIAGIARDTFKRFGLRNIQQVEGNLDVTLPDELVRLNKIDFAFLDGNHRLEPTLRYFNQCLGLAHESSVFVLDDIHWSEEMEQAWEQIKAHPRVMLTVDLFSVGLVFFRTNQPKQHFWLRY
jgi:predicted O-methyltransferase YrrM